MNPIDEAMQKQKQENYQKARKDLMQALDSFRKLDNEQKSALVKNMTYVAGLENAYLWLKSILG